MTDEMILDLDGFLSKEMQSSIEKIKTSHKEWFELATEINRLGELIITHKGFQIEVGSGANIKALAHLLLIRTMSNFQGVILLSERGMIVEARTLARSCMENLLFIAALKNDKNFIEAISKDNKDNARKRAKLLLDEKMEKLIKPEHKEQVEKFIKEINSIPKEKAQSLGVSALAEKGNLEELYVIYKQISSDSAHPSLDSLDRYLTNMEQKDGAFSIVDRVPHDSLEIPRALSLACMSAVSIYGVFLSISQINEEIANKVETLSQKYLDLDNSMHREDEIIKSSLLQK